jgi:tRNA(adenine34) deaminase
MMLEMNDEDFMKLAIDEAKRSQAAGGAPIGAVMVKDGQVIAKGQSLVWPEKDPSSHGETNCIRNASKVLHPNNLAGCTMYSTLESCSMCLGCAGWAELSRIVFGAYKEDIPVNPYELKDYHAEEHGKRLISITGSGTEITGGVLRKECAELMANIENWSPKE